MTTELPPACENSAAYRTKYDALYAPHTRRFYAGAGKRKLSYMVEDYINNRGFIDKDRRFENPDRALRILLQGECWTEGEQTTTNLHMNVLLESMLRRRTGVPVEVIVTAASSSSPASWSLPFEKYGSRFQPDVVLLFVNMFNMAHLEPTMLRKLIGWDKEHPPYKMYDFNKQGDLLEYLPDPAYPAFMTAADPSPIAGSVPLPQSYAVVGVQPALVQRSFQLLRAILAEQYLKRMQRNHGVLGLIVGYDKQNAPPYGDLHAPHMLAYDQWLAGVGDVCDSLKICMLDLSPSLMKEDFQNVLLWEHDGHLTPAGNYKFAEALADQVGALPEFRRWSADGKRPWRRKSKLGRAKPICYIDFSYDREKKSPMPRFSPALALRPAIARVPNCRGLPGGVRTSHQGAGGRPVPPGRGRRHATLVVSAWWLQYWLVAGG